MCANIGIYSQPNLRVEFVKEICKKVNDTAVLFRGFASRITEQRSVTQVTEDYDDELHLQHPRIS